jgi:acetyl esterase/lipase
MAANGETNGPDGLMVWKDLLERPRPQPTTTIRYGEDALQVVDLWLPEGAGPHPVALMVHGGCWQTDIADRTLMNWIAEDLRRRGVAVWNIDYRGVDRPGGGYPGTFLDAAAAADALRDHAARHNLDLSRVVAVGHSAGGHLALWLAARPAAVQRNRGVRIRLRLPGADAAAIERRMVAPLKAAIRARLGDREIISSVASGEATLVIVYPEFIQAAEAAYLFGETEALEAPAEGEMTIDTPSDDLPPSSPVLHGNPLAIGTVVSLGGLPDLEEAARPPGSGCGTEIIERLIGPASPERQDRFADTSVPRLAPLGVRQILVNGDRDRIIPTSYAEGYARPMRAAGDDVRVRMVDRTGHVELVAPGTAAWAAAVEEIVRALD